MDNDSIEVSSKENGMKRVFIMVANIISRRKRTLKRGNLCDKQSTSVV